MPQQPVGVSFSPMDPQNRESGNGEGAGASPIQDAIRVLSLRLPRFVGRGGIAPDPLLRGAGSAGVPFGSGGPGGGPGSMPGGLEQYLMQLFGLGGGMGATAPPPTPNVTPGLVRPGSPRPGPTWGTPPGQTEAQTPPPTPDMPIPQPPTAPQYPPQDLSLPQANPSRMAEWIRRGGITGGPRRF